MFANERVGRLCVWVTFVSSAAQRSARTEGWSSGGAEGSGTPSAGRSNAITPQAIKSVETLINKQTNKHEAEILKQEEEAILEDCEGFRWKTNDDFESFLLPKWRNLYKVNKL